jgi:hypothetical protein
MTSTEEGAADEMMMAEDSANNNNNRMTMNSSTPEASMYMSDDTLLSKVPSYESPQMESNHDGQTMESLDMNNSGAGQTQMINME